MPHIMRSARTLQHPHRCQRRQAGTCQGRINVMALAVGWSRGVGAERRTSQRMEHRRAGRDKTGMGQCRAFLARESRTASRTLATVQHSETRHGVSSVGRGVGGKRGAFVERSWACPQIRSSAQLGDGMWQPVSWRRPVRMRRGSTGAATSSPEPSSAGPSKSWPCLVMCARQDVAYV